MSNVKEIIKKSDDKKSKGSKIWYAASGRRSKG